MEKYDKGGAVDATESKGPTCLYSIRMYIPFFIVHNVVKSCISLRNVEISLKMWSLVVWLIYNMCIY